MTSTGRHQTAAVFVTLFTALGLPLQGQSALKQTIGWWISVLRSAVQSLLQLDQGDRYGNCKKGRSGQEGAR